MKSSNSASRREPAAGGRTSRQSTPRLQSSTPSTKNNASPLDTETPGKEKRPEKGLNFSPITASASDFLNAGRLGEFGFASQTAACVHPQTDSPRCAKIRSMKKTILLILPIALAALSPLAHAIGDGAKSAGHAIADTSKRGYHATKKWVTGEE